MTSVAAGDIEALAFRVLSAHGASDMQAKPVAAAIARAEAEGNAVCGLFYLPIFAAHLACGKVRGDAVPHVERDGAVLRVDAGHGFAHAAITAGTGPLIDVARETGIAAMSVRHSYNALALAHHVTPLAAEGLIGICMSNAPAAVAPPGATRPLFGINPLAFAAPGGAGDVIVVDQSLSAVTKTAMLMRKAAGEAIPLGWAQDAEGRPTTDPAAGLAGSLLAAGGQKGANLSLLVELLAAGLTGSSLSIEATSLGDDKGGPPDLGQVLLALDPARFGPGLDAPLARLADGFAEAGVRLPGARVRHSVPADLAIDVPDELWRRCEAL